MALLPPIFKRFSEREKLLIIVLLFLLFSLWMIWFVNRSKEFVRSWERSVADRDYHSQLLEEAPKIERILKKELDAIEKTRTLNASQLVGRVDKLARSEGFSYELSAPRTTEGDLFDLHRVTLTIRQASLSKLIAFEEALQKDFPYLALTSARLTAVPSNPALLDSTFIITSFELKSEHS